MSRAGRRAAAVLGLLLVALLAGTARADILQDLGATFEGVARELQAAMPKVEARITAVEGERVRLEGPEVARLRPGLELTAYRKGELFRHPVTDQPLGHAEDQVAILSVTAVEGTAAAARVVATEEGRAVREGDGARITAGRIRVAVLPPQGVAVAGETADETALLLVSRFSALLEKTGRFLPVEPGQVLAALRALPDGAAPSPLEVARRLDAAAVVASHLVTEGGARFLEVTWLSARSGAPLVERRAPVVRAVFPPRFAWEQTPELARRHPLEGPVRGLALADVDGDGRPELVVGSDDAVTVYRWLGGTGLVPAARGTYRPGGSVLSVDAADVNGVGRAQIVVVTHRNEPGGVRSTVLELADERLRPLHQAAGRYLRVVSVEGAPWLFEQPVGDTAPFAPTITRLVWDADRYRDGVRLRVPTGVTVYGLTLLRLTGAPEPEIVALTPEDRLAVWTARGQRLWTSADPYGGAAVTFAVFPNHAVRAQLETGQLIGRILGRVIGRPDAPQGPEVLVFENLLPAGSGLRAFLPGLASPSFTQGRVHRLRWQDGGFVRVWQSRPAAGYVTDFAYGDMDGDGIPEVVVGVVPRGLNLETLSPLGRPNGHLVFYELP